ncbi:MAG: hypothetical protein AAFV93_18640 [Chloroflexota bacterium]
MTKHEKRIQRARNNPKGVSYNDFISILENEGYIVQQASGSHMKASKRIDEQTFIMTFARPHRKKKTMHRKAIMRLLEQLDKIAELESDTDANE